MYGLTPNPLGQYHNLLRMGAMSGYPNLQYANPHPYQMSAAAIQNPSLAQQWQYDYGRQLQRRGNSNGLPVRSSMGYAAPLQQRARPRYGPKTMLYMQRGRGLRGIAPREVGGFGTPHTYHGVGPQQTWRIYS